MVGNAEICRSIAFWGVAAVLFSLFAAIGAIFVYRVYASLSKMAKRIGLASMALLGLLSIGATIGGTPTLEDKERSCQENNAWANVFGFGTNGVQNTGGVENVKWKMENVKLGDAPMIVPDSTETGILHFTFYTLHSNGVPVVAGTITAEDCAAGYVLSTVRTDETHSFDPPPDAVVCGDWLTFGAARDWIYENVKCKMENVKWAGDETHLCIHSDGWAEALPASGTTGVVPIVFSPFKADLGIVPEANWQQILHFTPYTLHSLFWHCLTPSNTLQMTWVNALLDRAATNPVSFQCEVSANGDVEFRYDLSALADDVISNVTVGVSCGGGGRCLGQLSKSVTSLRFARIDPFDAVLTDRDGDGISTVDEVFLRHTDPGNPDTDFDGLPDSDEIDVWHTDPKNPHTLRPDMPDGMAVKIGGENPWAYPEGSTNTIWEHVFYSGTTNGAFAYPQPDDATAVLSVTVSGEGSGELVVGGTVVPLLAPPQMRSGGVASSTLYARMAKGVTYPVHLRRNGTLDLTVTSDDFAFGILPSASAGVWSGRINFPNTEAPEVCVHHLETRTVAVSLPMSADAEALTCEWTGGDGVEAHNHPPRSATLEGDFSPSAGATFSYSIDHPERLFGATDYFQNVRFCPHVEEDPGGEEDDVPYCGCPAGCPCEGLCGGDCSCIPPEEPEICDEHGVPVDECAALHEEEDDHDEASLLPQMMGVLPLRVPTYHARTLHIDVPSGDYTPCCPCPEHAANHTDAAFVSHRLSVLTAGGLPFRTATVPCDVAVGGVAPSCVVGDAQLLLATNGAVSADLRYTVFGVGISSARSGVDLAALNVFAPDFGLPVAPGTNAPAVNLNLDLNVKLTHGRVRLSFVNPGCRFLVMAEIGEGIYRHWTVLADSETKPVMDVSITEWRRLFGKREGEDFSVPVAVMAAGTGTCDVKFTYWTVVDGAFAEDSAVQRITAVPPPLLADITRDGLIDAADIAALVEGRVFRYWINEDTDKGDYVGQSTNYMRNAANHVVDGRLDLVNLFPVKLDLKPFIDAWGNVARFQIYAQNGSFNFCGVDVSPGAVNTIQTEDVYTTGGDPLYAADLTEVEYEGVDITPSDYLGNNNEPGVLAFEALEADRQLTLAVFFGDVMVFQFPLPASFSSVRDMYRWLNIRSVCGDNRGDPSSLASPLNFPDDECDGNHFVFVHGYNVNPTQARAWADAMFKRLWWSGSKSRFTAVDWRGDESQVWEGIPIVGGQSLNYYVNVRHALDSAATFASAANALSGSKVMIAHSLGNMLVSEAAKCHSLNYARYYMLNAAVPMEAYDANALANTMVEHGWTDIDPSKLAARWYMHFSDNSDPRKTLKWKGRFAGIHDTINCYSSTEDVLANATDGLIGWGGEWSIQELFKGTATLHVFPGNCEGGWGYNSEHTNLAGLLTDFAKTNDFTDAELIASPVFRKFDNATLHQTNVIAIAQTELNKVMGDGIPATSFAAGANPIGNAILEDYNYQGRLRPNGWPRNQANWMHSDIKNVAYFYIYDFFDKLTGSSNQ